MPSIHEEMRMRATPTRNSPQSTADVAVEGIVDQRGEQFFVRAAGYLPGPGDTYLPPAMVRRHGVRPGDLVAGVAQPARNGRPGPLTRLDTIEGRGPDEARRRPEFYDLTPLYPHDRLRLETEPRLLTSRLIDLVMPLGKGQRALIVSPPKAGKTTVLQAIANGISQNHPDVHLMVVLVDERPEEVTDMRRSVRGEVIASTFDRSPQEHTALAELAIERAKRLVERGRDVVVLLDSLTRLGRAYNNAAPGGGRTLSGGIAATALQQPKRLLGAARAVEGGGSLTIVASALVDTGSQGDNLIYEEYKSTGNAELTLDRASAESRFFPAIDFRASGTRNEHLLLAADELAAVRVLRNALGGRDAAQALPQVLSQIARTSSNAEFLLRLTGTPANRLAA
jgi:transcription termination factor Rho